MRYERELEGHLVWRSPPASDEDTRRIAGASLARLRALMAMLCDANAVSVLREIGDESYHCREVLRRGNLEGGKGDDH